MSLCARMARRTGIGGISRGDKGLPIEVVARHGLGKRASVAIIRAGDRDLVVGVTDHTITLLAETARPAPVLDLSTESTPRTGEAPTAPWKALVTRAQEATVRR